MSAVASLWPTDIFAQTIRTPASVLKEQAAVIGEKTQNLIEGRVKSKQNPETGAIELKFSLIVPTMQNYSFLLLEADHEIKLYPVTVYSQILPNKSGSKSTIAKDEKELTEILRTIFNAEETKRIVVALLSQAKS